MGQLCILSTRAEYSFVALSNVFASAHCKICFLFYIDAYCLFKLQDQRHANYFHIAHS